MKAKRILSFLLVLVLCVAMFPATNVSAISTSSVEANLTSWRSNLDGKYWNYYDRSVYDSRRSYVQSQLISIATSGILSNPNATDAQVGVTSTACAGSTFATGCRSNYFAGAWQCRSFARFIDYALFGSTWAISSSGWTQFSSSALNSLKLQPGDHIVSSGHEAIIWKVSNGNISCVECWGGSGCKISYSPGFNWSQYTTESGLLSYLIADGGSVWRHDSVKNECTSHTKGGYLWYEATHPHYNYYRCSVCGTSFTDGSTTKVSSCEICNPKEYSIYYYVPADSEGNRWTKYKTETGLRGSTHEVPGDWPHMDQRYFSGWSYDINPTGYDLRPGDTFEVCPTTTDGDGYCVILYARYINHEDVVSGKPVLIYDPSEFTDSAYKLEPVNQTVTRREQHESLSDWSEWSSDSISPSNTVDVETSVVYRYYYFLCSKCGDHNPFSGNCGCGGTSNEWHQTWSPIPYSESNSSVVSYATYKRQTTSIGDGQLWYFSAGNLNDTSVGTIDSNGAAEVICNGYRSRTRTLTTSQKSETVTAYKATANHIHSMNHITAQNATCTKAGNVEYWFCTGCGKYYLDANGNTETTAAKITRPALGHNYSNGSCTRCGAADPNAAEPDPNAAVVSVVPVRGKAGETVEIAVTLANNPGFSDLSIEIGYNASVMELTKVTPNSAVGCIFTTSQQLTQLPYRLNWVNGTEDSTFTGTLVTLTFQIKDSAELGSYPVTVSYYKGKYGNNIDGEDVNYNQNGSRVPIIYVNGSVTVYSYTPGDLNGDGRINSKDAIYLLRYIAGWELDGLVEDALDVNGDGKINSKDAVHLLRYIAGWDVTLH